MRCSCCALFILHALLHPVHVLGLGHQLDHASEVEDSWADVWPDADDPARFDPVLAATLLEPAGFQLAPPPLPPSHPFLPSPLHKPLVLYSNTALTDPVQVLAANHLVTRFELEPLAQTPVRFDLLPAHEFTSPIVSGPSPTGVPDISAPLTTGFSMVDVPIHQRLSFGGRGWQRELDPGFRATIFGAEAKLGLTRRVDFRMGVELLQTDPRTPGLPSARDDSLYAQFRFRF